MARMVCSSTVYTWYMSYCIWATTRPKSGTNRLNTPASLNRMRDVTGSGPQSISRNSAFASLFLRSLASTSFRFWLTSRSAWGWTSRSFIWAAWNRRIIFKGSDRSFGFRLDGQAAAIQLEPVDIGFAELEERQAELGGGFFLLFF